jgi:hypothetical protein
LFAAAQGDGAMVVNVFSLVMTREGQIKAYISSIDDFRKF